ncbi:MAG: hypothetical protein WDO73_06245 [Ignavibacteriota bacterium]
MRTAPAIIAGARPATNFRPGPLNSGIRTRFDLWMAAAIPISNATIPSTNQTASHRGELVRGPAIQAATNAVDPMSIPPIPGTAVNSPARSSVRRIYRRLSMACSCSCTGSGRGVAI